LLNKTMTTVTGGNEMNNSVIYIAGDGAPALPRGRLIFGVDATASREATWTIARELQAQMFREAAPIGQLDMQLLFYGGDRCRASKWTSSGEQLAQLMTGVECKSGITQIARVLRHVLREHEKTPVQALTFIGDAAEEAIDTLSGVAGELGAVGVPCYMFLEGNNAAARRAFRLIALRSGGRFYEFNAATPQAIEHLAEHLSAVAHFAVSDQSGATLLLESSKNTNRRQP
jgi:hypothetical protein